jgi:hypothetical protein
MSLARLCYIAFHQKSLPVIPKSLKPYFSHSDLMTAINEIGVAGASSLYEGNEEQLKMLVKTGMQFGRETSIEEYRTLVAHMMYEAIEASDKPFDTKISLYSALNAFVKAKSTVLSQEITTFGTIPEEENSIIKPCGFTAFDAVLGGLPDKALTLFLARPGCGKSSMMLSFADSYKSMYPDNKILWVSYEMDSNAMLERARYLNNLTSDDTLICGATTIDEIEEIVTPETLVIIDYADKMITFSDDAGYRFQLMAIYHRMLSLAKTCKGVITASQVRRADKSITIDSPEESASKSQISEFIVGIDKGTASIDKPGYTQVTLSVVKNRYGRADISMGLLFNYKTLDCEHVSTGESGIDLAEDLNW